MLRDCYEWCRTVWGILPRKWRTFLLSAIAAVVLALWSHLKQLQGPEIVVLALTTLTCGLLLAILVPEFLRPRVKVTLIPDSKPAEIQLLTVQNDGAPLSLTAHCTLFSDRKLHHSSFGMVWANSKKTSATLPHGARCCLMIAKTGVDRDRKMRDQYNRPPQEDLHWIEIVGLSRSEEEEIKERGQWTHGDTPKEYELEITIVGENHKPHTECFTLKAGQTTALEMFAVACKAASERNDGTILSLTC